MSDATHQQEQQQQQQTTQQNCRIQALPQHVVDKIAAGEVVQRPASVIKELIENSLDANSTSILVHYEPTKLQVIDNGCGIAPQDLGLAATRFATSKLSSTEDFKTLSTFGFRGEALASISLVARLELVSRVQITENKNATSSSSSSSPTTTTTTTTTTGWIQSYLNGQPVLPHPKPHARVPGTTVTVTDLFYNVPHRKRALLEQRSSSSGDEFHRVLTVVQAYAIHYPQVTFVCRHKKSGPVSIDLNTGMLSAVKELQQQIQQQKQNIEEEEHSDQRHPDKNALELLIDTARRQVLTSIFRECTLHKVQFVEQGRCELQGLVSDPSSSTEIKKTQFILFCNHRWVESNVLKKSLESLYQEFVSNKSSKPLLYISIQVDPKEVDVNVHPSKKQVTLLYQDEIFASILAAVRKVLEGVGRTISTLPTTTRTAIAAAAASRESVKNPYANKRPRTDETVIGNNSSSQGPMAMSANKTVKPSLPKDKIRTTTAAPAEQQHEPTCALATPPDMNNPGAFAQRCTCVTIVRTLRRMQPKVPKIVTTDCTYKSVLSLRHRILVKHADEDRKRRLRKEAMFVGPMSEQRCLVQCGVELQEWDMEGLAQLLFQQLVLQQFGGMVEATVGPIDIAQVVGQLLELEDLLVSDDDVESSLSLLLPVHEAHESLANQVAMCLLDRADMLEEYFSIGVTKSEPDGRIVLTTLPVILPQHEPEPGGLSLFLLRLATQVNWDEEKPCFWQVSKELGLYYGSAIGGGGDDEMQHLLFPAICQLLVPPKKCDCFQTLTQLSTLYKAFER
ncbi:DNA mismatch repair protein Mlh1 C-terminus [Fragilaria crotonensis]|nr:DNA mismatch repair protein Mlh1 C-terminus [Fragilaria crotonensis]